MKYLILLIAMLTVVAEAKEPVSSCLRVKDVSTEKIRQGKETYVWLTLESSCPVVMESPDRLPVFEFQDDHGLWVTPKRTEWFQSGIYVLVKVGAAEDAALGNQTLHGLMHYKSLVSGSYSDETLPLDLPVHVLKPKTTNTLEHQNPVWVQDIANVGIGIAIVVFFPVVMILYMVGNGAC